MQSCIPSTSARRVKQFSQAQNLKGGQKHDNQGKYFNAIFKTIDINAKNSQ